MLYDIVIIGTLARCSPESSETELKVAVLDKEENDILEWVQR